MKVRWCSSVKDVICKNADVRTFCLSGVQIVRIRMFLNEKEYDWADRCYRFCSEHFRGDNHACPSPQASYVIPLCPLCDDPPRNWKRDEDPNIAMNAHLIPDPRTGHIECSKVEANGTLKNSASGSKSKKKENQCQAKRCAKIMVVPIKVSSNPLYSRSILMRNEQCTSCPSSFCPSHRAPVQHDCVSLLKAQKTNIRSNPVKQRQSHISPQSSFVSSDEKKHNRNKGGKDQGLDASSSTSPSGNPIRTIATLSQNMKMDKWVPAPIFGQA